MTDGSPWETYGDDLPTELEAIRSLRAQADDDTIAELDGRVEALFGLLGNAHGVTILRLFAVEGGPWRFSELEDRIDASSHTISSRLEELTDAGLLDRRQYEEIPPRVEYTWTEAAKSLTPAFQLVYLWALDNDLGRHDPDP